MNILSTKIESLNYSIIESEISDYYDMGCPHSSSFPIKFSEDTYGTFTLICDKKSGDFSIRISRQPDGQYSLFVSPVGKIKNKR